MAITNKVQFINQEKTTESSTTSPTFTLQGTMLDASKMTAGHNYMMCAWVNCTSPDTNEGATKFAFEDGAGDIEGSVQQRHDTNNSGMYIAHIGQFTAPDPPQNIGIYRKRITGSANELTQYGQCFAIDLSYSGLSGGMSSGMGGDYTTSRIFSERTVSPGATWHTHSVYPAAPATHLVFGAIKCYDSVDSVLVGMYHNATLVASGSRFTQDSADQKTVVFGGAYTLEAADTILLKNLDTHTASAVYSYICAIDLSTSPATNSTNQKSTWTDSSTSGSWGVSTMDGNSDASFVVGMGRQTELGADSGRAAAISLKNNTSDNWLLFNSRPSGEFNPLYFPATAVGQNNGQYETAVIIGVGTIGESDDIEMATL